MEAEQHGAQREHDGQLEADGEQRDDGLAEEDLAGSGPAGPQPFPGVPAVLAEDGEAHVADEEEREHHGAAGYRLLGTVGVADAGEAKRSSEGGLEEGDGDDRHQEEDRGEHGITAQETGVLADDDPATTPRHRPSPVRARPRPRSAAR